MNAHVAIIPAAEDSHKLSQGADVNRTCEADKEPPTSYRFGLGCPVLLGGKVWIVVDRQQSSMGREIYGIYRPRDIRPYRLILGHALAPAPVVMQAVEIDRLFTIAHMLKGPDSRYFRYNGRGPTRQEFERREPWRVSLLRQWSRILASAHKGCIGMTPGIYTSLV